MNGWSGMIVQHIRAIQSELVDACLGIAIHHVLSHPVLLLCSSSVLAVCDGMVATMCHYSATTHTAVMDQSSLSYATGSWWHLTIVFRFNFWQGLTPLY